MTNVLLGLILLAYSLASIASIVLFYMPELDRQFIWVVRGAWIFHTAVLGLRLADTGQPPFLSFFETISFFAWVLILNFILLDYFLKLRVAVTFVVPITFVLLMIAALTQSQDRLFGAGLGNSWAIAHGFTGLFGYGAFALAFVASSMYLVQENELRSKVFRIFYRRLPSLEALDEASNTLIRIGLGLITVTILTGSISASVAWGRFWGWEEKETWSLAMWAVYAAYVALRRFAGWRGRKPAIVSIVGFLMVIFNLFIVNILVSDLHRYWTF